MSAVDMSIGRGFLPPVDPITNLAAIYPPSASIVELAECLPELIKTRRVAERLDQIESLPYFEPSQFELPVLIRSYAVFMTILHAYILELGENNNPDLPVVLPKKIAHWVEYTAHSIDRLPTQNYETYVLQNYRLINPQNDMTLENIEPLLTYTGTTGEAWFIKMHVYAEYRAAKWMQISEKINILLRNNENIDLVHLTANLQTIADDLHNFNIDYFTQMKKHLSAQEFFHEVRPYIKAWKPGIGYTESDVYGSNIMKWRGASGAQSSFIPALDYLFGIRIEQQQTMKDMLNYMPPEHKAFLYTLHDSPLRKLVNDCDNIKLRDAYNSVIRSCAEFRKKHHNMMVAPYLINNLIENHSKQIVKKIADKLGEPLAPCIFAFTRKLIVSFFSKEKKYLFQTINISNPKNLSEDLLIELLNIFNDTKKSYEKHNKDANISFDFKIIFQVVVEQLGQLTSNTLGTGGEDFRLFLSKNCEDTQYSLL